MKYLRIALLLIVVVMRFPAALLAQEADGTDLLEALAIVQAAYGEEIIILSATHDADNACWQFEFADGTAVCVDETTGEILPGDSTDSGAVDDTDEGALEDTNDTEVDDTDDAAVEDTGDGAVDDIDDGEVEDNDDFGILPTTTLEEAITTALSLFPDSAVTSVSFQMLDDGSFTWDIGLDDVLSMDVDAMTGEVLLSGDETNDTVGAPVDSVDDSVVEDTGDGVVDNIDDGAVEDTGDSAVGNQDEVDQGSDDEGDQGHQDHDDEGDQGHDDEGDQGD